MKIFIKSIIAKLYGKRMRKVRTSLASDVRKLAAYFFLLAAASVPAPFLQSISCAADVVEIELYHTVLLVVIGFVLRVLQGVLEFEPNDKAECDRKEDREGEDE